MRMGIILSHITACQAFSGLGIILGFFAVFLWLGLITKERLISIVGGIVCISTFLIILPSVSLAFRTSCLFDATFFFVLAFIIAYLVIVKYIDSHGYPK